MEEKTNHHIIPKTRADEWYNVHHKSNQWLIEKQLHRDMHLLFGDMTPQEQFNFLLQINWAVIEQSIKDILLQLFSMDPKDFYETDIINKRKI